MAKGVCFTLASYVLCDIYRGLNDVVYCERGSSKVTTYYSTHFLFAWLRFYFSFVFGVSDAAQFKDDIILRKFSHHNFVNQSFVGMVDYLLHIDNFDNCFYRMVSLSVYFDKFSSNELSFEEKEFFISLQPCLLPLRDGAQFHMEPYFPN
ncbi:hypothetical protein ACLOJK_028211 [Asimina triloba]